MISGFGTANSTNLLQGLARGLRLFESVLTEGSSWDGSVDLGLTLVGHLVEMTEPRPLMVLGLGTASSLRHTLEGLIHVGSVDLRLTLSGTSS